jgi:flagellin
LAAISHKEVGVESITNVNSMQALHAHQANRFEVDNSLHRLATGKRINRAADDPAGLISAEQLAALIEALEAESRAAERTQHVAATADAALGEISAGLADLRGLAVANANTGAMSDAEREANQIEMDSIIQSIDRIASTATFNGQKLFDGGMSLSVGGDTLTIDRMSAAALGTLTDGGAIDVNLADLASGGAHVGDDAIAGEVIAAAVQQVSTLRGKLGSFENSLQSHVRSTGVALTNTLDAFSQISDTDYAFETARAVRAETLSQASLMALGASTDAQRQSIVKLLG